MLAMFNAMYADEPILSTAILILLAFVLLLPIIMLPFTKRWDAKRAKETEEQAMKIWDADATEDKKYAWAYVDNLANISIKHHTRKTTYNYRSRCGRK